MTAHGDSWSLLVLEAEMIATEVAVSCSCRREEDFFAARIGIGVLLDWYRLSGSMYSLVTHMVEYGQDDLSVHLNENQACRIRVAETLSARAASEDPKHPGFSVWVSAAWSGTQWPGWGLHIATCKYCRAKVMALREQLQYK